MNQEFKNPVIERLIIQNYKKFKNFEISFNDDINIVVGSNEAGKTTIIEAINICLKLQINNRSIASELSPHIFNENVVKEYYQKLKKYGKENPTSSPLIPPSILIEVYFKEGTVDSIFKGSSNSKRLEFLGIKVKIEFDIGYLEEFKSYVESSNVDTIPIEYYTINRTSFADSALSFNNLPLKSFTIVNMENRFQNGVDKFITEILDDAMDVRDRAKMSVSYRSLKQQFVDIDEIKKVNKAIENKNITNKNVMISIDTSTKTNIDSSLTLYLDNIPLRYSGKGEQTAIKAKLVLNSNIGKINLIMMEEPETNQSFSNMRQLISSIIDMCDGKQIIITTHSSYVLNKYGLNKLILLSSSNSESVMHMNKLESDTYSYFKKLPGYDTLRVILSKKIILVEGPSDELIVQKAYMMHHSKVPEYQKVPLDDGIDIISVNSLAFVRFLEILKIVGNEVHVITDNDGDPDSNRINGLKKYESYKNIHIHYSSNSKTNTLEPCFVECNDLNVLNTIFNVNYKDKFELIKYLKNDKTDWAMKIFDTDQIIKFPEYIMDVFKE